MFLFKRSAGAVLLPIVLLIAVVAWSNRPIGTPRAARPAIAAELTSGEVTARNEAQRPAGKRDGG